MNDRNAIVAALLAALLFGASTPFAKGLAADVPPVILAGLLYLGSGIGLWGLRLVRGRKERGAPLEAGDWPWFGGAIVSGGIAGPILLMFGLTRTAAAHASLLLNLEAVLTAVLAWVVFGENADRRVVLGMAAIVAGGVVLAWPGSAAAGADTVGALAVAGACLCWAIDNNLTRKVSASDALFIAATKGAVAGATNLALGLSLGGQLPELRTALGAMTIGFAGYGVSLVLFVIALRGLGSARTGAYFSTAPFMGALLATLVFRESTGAGFWIAAALMAAGVWLHLTERHEHEHAHEPLTHTHTHRHDAHHRHEHPDGWDGSEPHSHEHRHAPLTHEHAHYPDVHHRHAH